MNITVPLTDSQPPSLGKMTHERTQSHYTVAGITKSIHSNPKKYIYDKGWTLI